MVPKNSLVLIIIHQLLFLTIRKAVKERTYLLIIRIERAVKEEMTVAMAPAVKRKTYHVDAIVAWL